MNTRFIILLPLFLVLFAPSMVLGQGAGGADVAAPVLTCGLELSDDSLFFQNNDYAPNQVTVTITVTNTGNEDADSVYANLQKDPRFVLDEPARKLIAVKLAPSRDTSVTYVMKIAAAASRDTTIEICGIITSTRTNTRCCKNIWIEHEYLPQIKCSIEKQFIDLEFKDDLGDYDPNPFEMKVSWINQGDGPLLESIVKMPGTPGVSPDTTDNPVKMIGTIPAFGSGDALFKLVAIHRQNDTTVTIDFIIEGRGGYRDYLTGEIPLRQWFCSDTVHIPQARQPIYQLICEVEPDTVFYRDHKYDPPTFKYRLRIKNIGTADGVVITASMGNSPGAALITDQTVSVLNSLDQNKLEVGDTSQVIEWEFTPQPTRTWDTLYLVATVKDLFNYTASVSCPIYIDSIRSTEFKVECICPDTLRVDTLLGQYVPNPFPVSFIIDNMGTDYADSVVATISIQTPDVVIVEPFEILRPLAAERNLPLPARNDTLSPQSSWEVTWPLEALPRGFDGPITIRFTVDAPNADAVSCECVIYIPRLDPPDLRCEIITIPDDSLHISSLTGLYDPDTIYVKIKVWNVGSGVAKNVIASFSVPPKMLVDTNYIPITPLTPANIGPNDTAYAEWRIIPLARTEKGELIDIRVDFESDNVEGISPCVKQIFIPALPVTSALSISRDNVTYCGAASIAVPVSIDQSDTKDIHELDLYFRYNIDEMTGPFDPILEFTGVLNGPQMPADWSINKIDVTAPDDPMYIGHVRLSGSTALSGYGRLFYLVFHPVFCDDEDKLSVAASEILWPPEDEVKTRVLINQGSIQPVLRPGLVFVSGDCLRPVDASENYIITQNRPNPFNPTTTIDYKLPKDSHVRIEVFDALGRSVRVLVDQVMEHGEHSVVFDASDLPSGMYIYRMDAPNFTKIKKMMVSK